MDRFGSFTLVQLKTFRLLAREQNFTRTADLLNLTQPAVTQQVRALEDHFGVKLVDVTARLTTLTEAGSFLAERAEVLLGNVESLAREMREFADVRAGELRLGASMTIGSYALPELVAAFHQSFPAIRLRVEVANTATIARAVKAGRVSLALVEGPLVDAELELQPYADDELILVVAPSHALAKRKTAIRAEVLAELPFISRESGSGTRAQVERVLSEAGIEPRVVLTLPSGEGIVRAVELGIGVAIVSRLVVDSFVAQGRVNHVRMQDLEFRRTFRIVRLRRQTPSPAGLAFVALLLGTQRH